MTWKMFPGCLGRAEWGQAGAHMCVLAPHFDHVASSLLCLYVSINMGGELLRKKYLAKATFGMRALFGLPVWGYEHYFVEGTAGRERPQITLHLQLGSRER